jgi:hypothetical protein
MFLVRVIAVDLNHVLTRNTFLYSHTYSDWEIDLVLKGNAYPSKMYRYVGYIQTI